MEVLCFFACYLSLDLSLCICVEGEGCPAPGFRADPARIERLKWLREGACLGGMACGVLPCCNSWPFISPTRGDLHRCLESSCLHLPACFSDWLRPPSPPETTTRSPRPTTALRRSSLPRACASSPSTPGSLRAGSMTATASGTATRPRTARSSGWWTRRQGPRSRCSTTSRWRRI